MSKNITLTLLCFSYCISIFSQDQYLSNSVNDENSFFKFSGGLGALLQNGNGSAGSFDLSSTTLDYFIPLGYKLDSFQLKDQFGSHLYCSRYLKYKGVNLQIINRAAINLDSVNVSSNDYISSLEASPLTVRLSHHAPLNNHHKLKGNQWLPSLSYRISGDVRAIPFTNVEESVKIGTSAHLFISLLSQFKAVEFENNQIKEKGNFYLEPSIGIVRGSEEMMCYIINNHKNIFMVTELKFGFSSSDAEIQDWGFLIRYTWEDLKGPQFRIGLKIIPD